MSNQFDNDIEDEEYLKNAQISLEIITHSGNARNIARESIAWMEAGDFKKCEDGFIEAEKEIALAHKAQTDIIQNEAQGERMEFTILFVHAQDTLMTSSSELWMSKSLCRILKSKATDSNN